MDSSISQAAPDGRWASSTGSAADGEPSASRGRRQGRFFAARQSVRRVFGRANGGQGSAVTGSPDLARAAPSILAYEDFAADVLGAPGALSAQEALGRHLARHLTADQVEDELHHACGALMTEAYQVLERRLAAAECKQNEALEEQWRRARLAERQARDMQASALREISSLRDQLRKTNGEKQYLDVSFCDAAKYVTEDIQHVVQALVHETVSEMVAEADRKGANSVLANVVQGWLANERAAAATRVHALEVAVHSARAEAADAEDRARAAETRARAAEAAASRVSMALADARVEPELLRRELGTTQSTLKKVMLELERSQETAKLVAESKTRRGCGKALWLSEGGDGQVDARACPPASSRVGKLQKANTNDLDGGVVVEPLPCPLAANHGFAATVTSSAQVNEVDKSSPTLLKAQSLCLRRIEGANPKQQREDDGAAVADPRNASRPDSLHLHSLCSGQLAAPTSPGASTQKSPRRARALLREDSIGGASTGAPIDAPLYRAGAATHDSPNVASPHGSADQHDVKLGGSKSLGLPCAHGAAHRKQGRRNFAPNATADLALVGSRAL